MELLGPQKVGGGHGRGGGLGEVKAPPCCQNLNKGIKMHYRQLDPSRERLPSPIPLQSNLRELGDKDPGAESGGKVRRRTRR